MRGKFISEGDIIPSLSEKIVATPGSAFLRVAAALAASITAAAALLSLAQAQQAAPPGPGLYAQSQADQGHMLFNNYCAECHRPDLTGAAGPALKGPTFLSRWGGRPVSDLYSFEHTKMPATNPGSLSDDKLLPITAYILERNGFPAGTTALDTASLGKMLPKQ